MSLSKLFQRIIWHNNTTPAINEDNLNAMSKAIDDIDDRVILIGDDVVTVIPQIQAYLEQAESIVEAVEELSQNPPYIGANGNWYVFDTTLEAYKDSGVDASITVDIADITMIAEGAQPYVTNTGTSTDPIFHLFLPRSPQGATGNGIANIAKTGTQGLVDTYTITMTDGTTYTFTVTNGQGMGDMTKAVYDSTNAVADAGGITDYVEGKVAPMLNILGAKNLLPNTGVSQTLGNTTYTVNANGTINATSSAAETDYYNMKVHIFDSFPYDSCVYSISDGGSDEGSLSKYIGYIVDSTTSENIAMTPDGGVISGRKGHRLEVYVQIRPGYQAVNHVFYPMIRLSSIADSTYEPYALTNQQLTPYALSQSNPNLLDNPWFTVNQRGESSYTSQGYTVDRWKISNNVALSLSNEILTLTTTASYSNMLQYLESERLLEGKTYTLSILCSDDSVQSKTFILQASSNWVNIEQWKDVLAGFYATYRLDNGRYTFIILDSNGASERSASIKAVKLELGSVSTLAQDTAPNYATELLKCQRYFYRMNTGGGIFQRIGIARASTATAVEPQVKLPTTMRSNPSVTVGGNITAFNIIGNGSSVAASSYSGTRFYGDYKKILFSAASNLVVNELYSIEVASTAETDTTYIDFSADL